MATLRKEEGATLDVIISGVEVHLSSLAGQEFGRVRGELTSIASTLLMGVVLYDLYVLVSRWVKTLNLCDHPSLTL